MKKDKSHFTIRVTIKENSLLARIAAKRLGAKQLAIVVNKTIYLFNTSKASFVTNKSWLLHELKHVEQYQRYGTIMFIILYTIQSVRNGYTNNKYEIEARNGENDITLLEKYSFL